MLVSKRKYNDLKQQYQREFAEAKGLQIENQLLQKRNKKLSEDNRHYSFTIQNQEAAIQELLIDEAEREDELWRYKHYGLPVSLFLGVLSGICCGESAY